MVLPGWQKEKRTLSSNRTGECSPEPTKSVSSLVRTEEMFVADQHEIMNNRLPIPEGEKAEKARK